MRNQCIYVEENKVIMPANQVWMTQHQLAGLFQCFVSKINANVRAILKTGVLDETNVCRMYHYKNGNSIEEYNLEMIMALAFRIKSPNAELFRNYLMKKALAETGGVLPILIGRDWNDIQLN